MVVWTKFDRKWYFQPKRENLNTSIEFELVQVPNFILNFQFWFLGTNFSRNGISYYIICVTLPLNLCSFKWLKTTWSRVLSANCNPTRLYTLNASKCNDCIELNKDFLNALYDDDVMFGIFISSLFHSFIILGKKEFIKYSAYN